MRGLPNHVKISVFVSLLSYSFVIVLVLNLLLSNLLRHYIELLCGFVRIILKKYQITPLLGCTLVLHSTYYKTKLKNKLKNEIKKWNPKALNLISSSNSVDFIIFSLNLYIVPINLSRCAQFNYCIMSLLLPLLLHLNCCCYSFGSVSTIVNCW